MIVQTLMKIQAELRAPKKRFNKFGQYPYRSCEDIVEAAKPLCHKNGVFLLLTDEVVCVGNRNYVKATAMLVNAENERIASEGFAREEETKKGMDGAQITGAASSYARKYALNGLFAIDDTADADATNTHDKEAPVISPVKASMAELSDESMAHVQNVADGILEAIAKGDDKVVFELAEGLDSDQRVYLWDMWKEDSKLRSRVKKIVDTFRQIKAQAA